MEENQKQTQGPVNVQSLIRVLSVIAICFFFVPMFLVSCSGSDVEISGIGLAGGYTVGGETVVSPQIQALIMLIIPIAILIIWIIKKLTIDQKAKVTIVLATIDFVIWFVVRAKVKNYALNNYCDFRITNSFVLNQLVLIIIVALGVLIATKKLYVDKQLKEIYDSTAKSIKDSEQFKNIHSAAKDAAQDAQAAINAAKQSRNETARYCSNCGKPIDVNAKYCENCGAKIE